MREMLQDLYAQARSAMSRAYNPYSNYAVGAALLTDSGTIYAGCNVENVSYSMTICAETNAVGTMVAAEGHTRIAHMLLVASGSTFPSPCGACRQKLAEFSTPETMVYFARPRDEGEGFDVRSYRMSTLLPLSFTQAVLWDHGAQKVAQQATAQPTQPGVKQKQ